MQIEPDISWIIPAYKDERYIRKTVENSFKFLKSTQRSFEIILVNDGSQDLTAARLQEIFLENPKEVWIIHHEKNRGYGEALKTGFRHARARRWIGYTDGDGQYDPVDLLDGYRRIEHDPNPTALLGFKTRRADGLWRRCQSATYNAIVKFLFNVKFRDINCSLKLFPAESFRQLSLESRSGFIDAEILLGLNCLQVRFEEIPVRHFKRGELAGFSTSDPGFGIAPRVILETLTDIIRYRVKEVTSANSHFQL